MTVILQYISMYSENYSLFLALMLIIHKGRDMHALYYFIVLSNKKFNARM